MGKAKDMKLCFASVISEIKQSPIFLTVKARLFETPRANLNGARVTPAFLDEIVENQDKYVGLPLCADVKALANGNYNRLGHLYNARTGEFHSTQIGSFYKYEKEDFDGGSYLIGYARIMKRNKAICKAIAELFADNSLKFSFEITCGSYEELDDGTIQIDAAEENFLEGAAIVSFPACEDAIALELVAECNKLTDTIRKGEKSMTDVENIEYSVIKEQPINAENKEEAVTEIAEEEKVESEQLENNEEEVNADCNKEKKENATVHITEDREETVSTYAYDDQTGVDMSQRVTIETRVTTHEEGTLVNDNTEMTQTEVVAEDDDSADDENSEDTEENNVVDTEDQSKKKTAEEMIAEVLSAIASLKAEIEELRETHKQTAAIKADNETINPFLAEITTPIENEKYSLLESAKNTNSYSLLDKA